MKDVWNIYIYVYLFKFKIRRDFRRKFLRENFQTKKIYYIKIFFDLFWVISCSSNLGKWRKKNVQQQIIRFISWDRLRISSRKKSIKFEVIKIKWHIHYSLCILFCQNVNRSSTCGNRDSRRGNRFIRSDDVFARSVIIFSESELLNIHSQKSWNEIANVKIYHPKVEISLNKGNIE